MSPSREDYIKTIYKYCDKNGYCLNKDISKELKVSKPSVSEMIKKLLEDEYIYTEKTKIYLSDKGEKKAKTMISIHRLWEKFLKEYLEYEDANIHEQADLLEHVTSEELMNSLNRFMKYPKKCPHGQDIYLNLE